MMTNPQCDLVAVLLDEHRELERRTEPLGSAGAGDVARVVAQLLTEVLRYGRTLQGHLDPLVRRYLPDGAAHADRHLSAHIEVERTVAELRRCRPGGTRCTELLGRLVPQLRDRLSEQERELLPWIRDYVPADVLVQRGLLALRGA